MSHHFTAQFTMAEGEPQLLVDSVPDEDRRVLLNRWQPGVPFLVMPYQAQILGGFSDSTCVVVFDSYLLGAGEQLWGVWPGDPNGAPTISVLVTRKREQTSAGVWESGLVSFADDSPTLLIDAAGGDRTVVSTDFPDTIGFSDAECYYSKLNTAAPSFVLPGGRQLWGVYNSYVGQQFAYLTVKES